MYIHIVCNMNYLNIPLGMVGTHGLTFKGLEVEFSVGLNLTMRSAWKINAFNSCSLVSSMGLGAQLWLIRISCSHKLGPNG